VLGLVIPAVLAVWVASGARAETPVKLTAANAFGGGSDLAQAEETAMCA
jgi:hypothetical protein